MAVKDSFSTSSSEKIFSNAFYEIVASKPASSLFGSETLVHGLGITPVYMVMISVNGTWYATSYTDTTAGGLIEEHSYVYVDSSVVTCFIITPTGGSLYSETFSRTFRVILLRDKPE